MQGAVILEQHEYNAIIERVASLEKMVQGIIDNPVTIAWYSVAQAAEALSRHECTVRQMCKDGKLNYKQTKRKIEVSVKSVSDYNLKYTIS